MKNMENKVCKNCKEEKELQEYKNNKRKDGSTYYFPVCRKCTYQRNKNTSLITTKKWREKNKEHIKEYSKNYAKLYYKKKWETDTIYRIKVSTRILIKNSIKRKGFIKKSRTTEILGMDVNQFKLYIESMFEDWMNWDNYGKYNGGYNYGWDIDHIVPCSSAKTEEEVILLNHYTNLQPLCSKVNHDIKKDNYSII